MRRAINCVYCPPKSSTTTPPSSAFILPPCSCAPVSSAASLAALSVMRPPFTQDKIEQFVRHINLLHDALSVHMLRDSRELQRQANHIGLGGPDRNLHPGPQAPIHLDRNFDLLLAREFLIERRPAYFPESFAVAQHLPTIFGEARRHW